MFTCIQFPPKSPYEKKFSQTPGIRRVPNHHTAPEGLPIPSHSENSPRSASLETCYNSPDDSNWLSRNSDIQGKRGMGLIELEVLYVTILYSFCPTLMRELVTLFQPLYRTLFPCLWRFICTGQVTCARYTPRAITIYHVLAISVKESWYMHRWRRHTHS